MEATSHTARRPPRGSELELRIDSLAYGGAGVARLDGYVVFVQGAVPGDLVRAVVGKAKRSYWWFTPVDQPEGWFDENGKRLGGTALAEPKPDSKFEKEQREDSQP